MNPNTKILSQLAGLDDVEICLADLPANPSPKESQYDPISLAGKRAFATPRTVALLLGSHLIRQRAPFGSPPTYRLTVLGERDAASCLKWMKENENS